MSRPFFLLLSLLTVSPAAVAGTPRFTVRDAIKVEWDRQPIKLDKKARAALPPADRARLERAERRIGAPGAPALLPPELDQPSYNVTCASPGGGCLGTWEALAKRAKTPQERFTALHFLNRKQSMHALSALEGLTVADAKTWPRHLHLDAHVATARLLGEVTSAELNAFLAALPVDAVRAQAARLRLVLEGKEKAMLPPLPPTSDAVLSLLDAWNRAPWPVRQADHLALLKALLVGMGQSDERAWAGLGRQRGAWSRLGLQSPTVAQLLAVREAAIVRLIDGTRDLGALVGLLEESHFRGWPAGSFWQRQWRGAVLQAMDRMVATAPEEKPPLAVLRQRMATLAPDLEPNFEEKPRAVLTSPDVLDRARFLEKMAAIPDFFDELVTRVFADTEVDSLQALIAALKRLNEPGEKWVAVLSRFLGHPTWIARYEAWKALSAVDAKTPWPKAPAPTAVEQKIIDEAARLADAARPVRLQITFAGNRTIVLKLDPVNAPINVANLVLLTSQKFFDGRRVPRVVPDFVVQMGSPIDTMDGGPGYAVRCEDSLDWYGPGSVGMALSGKDTGGSQFFITTNATPHLTGRYTRVGELEAPDAALPILDNLELGAKIERVEVLP